MIKELYCQSMSKCERKWIITLDWKAKPVYINDKQLRAICMNKTKAVCSATHAFNACSTRSHLQRAGSVIGQVIQHKLCLLGAEGYGKQAEAEECLLKLSIVPLKQGCLHCLHRRSS